MKTQTLPKRIVVKFIVYLILLKNYQVSIQSTRYHEAYNIPAVSHGNVKKYGQEPLQILLII